VEGASPQEATVEHTRWSRTYSANTSTDCRVTTATGGHRTKENLMHAKRSQVIDCVAGLHRGPFHGLAACQRLLRHAASNCYPPSVPPIQIILIRGVDYPLLVCAKNNVFHIKVAGREQCRCAAACSRCATVRRRQKRSVIRAASSDLLTFVEGVRAVVGESRAIRK
jgi:hypothetical protein